MIPNDCNWLIFFTWYMGCPWFDARPRRLASRRALVRPRQRSRRSRRSRVMDVPDPCRLNASPLDHWIDMLLAASQHPAGASRRSSKSRGCLQRSLKILQGSCLRDLRDPQNEETMNRSNNPKAWFLVGWYMMILGWFEMWFEFQASNELHPPTAKGWDQPSRVAHPWRWKGQPQLPTAHAGGKVWKPATGVPPVLLEDATSHSRHSPKACSQVAFRSHTFAGRIAAVGIAALLGPSW